MKSPKNQTKTEVFQLLTAAGGFASTAIIFLAIIALSLAVEFGFEALIAFFQPSTYVLMTIKGIKAGFFALEALALAILLFKLIERHIRESLNPPKG